MNSNQIEKIGDYVLEKTVGIGSFGKVKRACHEPTGCSVAVKIINKQNLHEKPDLEKKMRREIDNLKKFRHPHIIQLYEVIETESNIYLVMELVSGGELFDYIIKSGRLSENEGRYFFQQMISALGYCHKHKVAHRDLKPENILLTDSKNSIKIADFGLSNIMQDGELLKTSCGSPNYAAPEVIDGKYYSGEEVDVWSSGVILYAILTARLPFDDEYIPHLFNKIKRGKFKMPSYLSGPCQDLIRQMLNTDPLKRITIPEIIQHPWFKENVPQYLYEYLENVKDSEAIEFNEMVLMELEDIYNMDSKTLIDLISKGDINGKTNKYRVSYLLLSDRMKGDKAIMPKLKRREVDNLSRSLAELSTSPFLNLRDEIPFLHSHTQINVLDALQHEQNGKDSVPLSSRDVYSQKEIRRKKIWYLGIISKLSPQEIMTEVFRSLKKLDFEWKVVQPFQIHARYKMNNINYADESLFWQQNDDYVLRQEKEVKISIQLFKIQKEESEQAFLIDIKKIQGHPLVFIDQCSLLIKELEV